MNPERVAKLRSAIHRALADLEAVKNYERLLSFCCYCLSHHGVLDNLDDSPGWHIATYGGPLYASQWDAATDLAKTLSIGRLFSWRMSVKANLARAMTSRIDQALYQRGTCIGLSELVFMGIPADLCEALLITEGCHEIVATLRRVFGKPPYSYEETTCTS